MPIGLTKNYKEAAEAIKKFLKNVKVKKKVRKVGTSKQNIIEVIGDWSHFDIMDMDSWEGRLKFEFLDVEPKTAKEKKFRGEMAMENPQVANLFISKTSMFVYKQVKREIVEDGKVVKTEKTWKDITREWIQKMQRNAMFKQGQL